MKDGTEGADGVEHVHVSDGLGSLSENTANQAVNGLLSPLQHLMLAQHRFISDQTTFIHDPKNLPHMFDSQLEYLVGLQRYFGEVDLPTILSIQERWIAEMQSLVEQKVAGS